MNKKKIKQKQTKQKNVRKRLIMNRIVLFDCNLKFGLLQLK